MRTSAHRLRQSRYRPDGDLAGWQSRCAPSERAHRRTDVYVRAAQRWTWNTPSREHHIIQVRGYFRIEVYERPGQITQGSLDLEAQRELLVAYSPCIEPRNTLTGQ